MPPLKLPRFFLFISLQALWSQVLDASFEGSCLLGGFYFVSGRNMVVDHSIQGAGFLNLTVSSPIECFRECSWNCRCISFNFRRSLHFNNCELNEESRSTAPRSLKKEVGCHHYDLVMDYSVLKGSSKTCINNCCKSKPCSNNGTCADVCSSQGKRFHCSCLHGYTGTLCQKPPTSCKDYYRTGANTTGNYSIVDQQNQPMTVYCDFSTEPGFVWTLITSYSLANKKQFKNYVYYLHDAPISEDVPNWDAYRLSLSHMKFIRGHTTHWRATCNFPTDGIQFRDYFRAIFDNFDLLDASSEGFGICQKYEFLNIRGIECSNCTAATYHGYYLFTYMSCHIDSYLNLKGCEFDAKNGSVILEKNFGFYYKTNPNFRCTASPTSTTQIWFGSH